MHIYAVPAVWKAASMHIYAVLAVWGAETQSMHIYAVLAVGAESRQQNLCIFTLFSLLGNTIKHGVREGHGYPVVVLNN